MSRSSRLAVPPPWMSGPCSVTLRDMDDPRIRLAHSSLALLSAAERLQQDAGDRACATFLPDALECIEQSLSALSRGCDGVAHALIPPGDLAGEHLAPIRPSSGLVARSREWRRAVPRAAGPTAGLDRRHCGGVADSSRVLRADGPTRGRDDGGARDHARVGTPERDAEGGVTIAVRAMTVSSAHAPATRSPDNELYDRGCDLVEAATAIRHVASAPEATRAVPAVLGCVEAAMRELLWAVAALEATSARTVERGAGRRDSRTRHGSPSVCRSAMRTSRPLSPTPSAHQRRLVRSPGAALAARCCVSAGQPRRGRSTSHVQVAGGSLAGNDHSLISSTVGRVDVGCSSLTSSVAGAGGSSSGGRLSGMSSSLHSPYRPHNGVGVPRISVSTARPPPM